MHQYEWPIQSFPIETKYSHEQQTPQHNYYVGNTG